MIASHGKPHFGFFFFSVEDACVRVLRSGGTCGSVSGGVGDFSREEELTPYLDDDGAHDWGFADAPVDSHVNGRTIFRQDFGTVQKLCDLANIMVLGM